MKPRRESGLCVMPPVIRPRKYPSDISPPMLNCSESSWRVSAGNLASSIQTLSNCGICNPFQPASNLSPTNWEHFSLATEGCQVIADKSLCCVAQAASTLEVHSNVATREGSSSITLCEFNQIQQQEVGGIQEKLKNIDVFVRHLKCV